MKLKVFLMVYQGLEILQLNLKCLYSMSGVSDEDIFIIDMGIDAEVREWLENQKRFSYICAEKMENYASILNTAIKEFSTVENILLLNANFICLDHCIQKLEEACFDDEKIGAVIPVNFVSLFPEKPNIAEALEIIKKNTTKGEQKEVIKLPYEYVFLTRRFINEIGKMDEQLLLPDTVMVDYSFRGLCQKWKYILAEDAFVYEIISQMDFYTSFLGENADRNVLKTKWGMNYFNGVPNENLVKAIDRQKDEAFTVLEIGCDCGANLLHIKNLFPKAQLFGTEINSRAAIVASSFCEVITGNIEDCNLPYPEHIFDYILFGDVLEHLRDPEKVVAYCKRFLKQQGKIIACIPNLMHYTVLRDLINGNFTYQDTGLLDRTHIHFFTYNEIVRMFSRAGYQIDASSYIELDSSMSEEDKQFVAQIKRIGTDEEFFYRAFQYLVVAKSDAIKC
ncbi:MAG: methyltransferase domain-containing protein [Lachnospiraceae bacterium]|nr:methyltransferase domain-containing protein [Lachnospiraceae bacterium]